MSLHPRRYRPRLEALEDRTLPAAGLREQFMLELINRMRTNPVAELPLLLNSSDPAVQGALSFFNVNQTLLAQQWATLTAAPPLAYNDSLAAAALFHSQQMLAFGQQEHQLPGEPDLGARATAFGYTGFSSLGENIFAFAESVFHTHAAFAIDFGVGPGGIQNPPGHRQNLMSTGFREVGLGIVDAPAGATTGPILVTQDFGNRFNFGNPFLLGVAFNDANSDGFYSQGEGLGGVTVTVSGTGGNFVTTTAAAGGYQLKVPAGTYTVTFSGGSLASPVVMPGVVVLTANVKVDAKNQPSGGTLQFDPTSYSVTEGGGSVTVTVTRTNGSAGIVTVQFATGTGTATAGSDYTATSGTLTFNPGETSKTFTVQVGNDTQPEDTETIPLTLSNTVGATLGQASATINILDDESPGVIEFAADVFRVGEDAGIVTVTVTRTDGGAGGVTVNFTTGDATAVAGVDYETASGQLTFAAGQTSQTFVVTVHDDAVIQGKRTFTLTLSNPGGGATLGVRSAARFDLLDKDGKASERYVADVFLDVLRRPVDTAGRTFWAGLLDAGVPRSVLVDAITHSDEYFATNVIKPAYRKFLGREADEAGLTFWTARMRAGLTDEQLEAGFIGSPEFFQVSGGTNQAWIQNMYLTLLGRPSDAAGEAFWLQLLQQGADRASIALGFAVSPEREALAVQDDYLRFLGRRPNDTEVAFWVNAFAQGVTNEQIVTGFVGSDEYFQNQIL